MNVAGNADSPLQILLTATEGFPDYALLDSGHGRKLERFSHIIVDRPEMQAMWSPHREASVWRAANGAFNCSDGTEKGCWRFRTPLPDTWYVRVNGLPIACRFGSFYHLGVFPEQYPHWQWMAVMIRRLRLQQRRPRLLNLFGYTGAASLLAVVAGAEVTHVDASRKAISWARSNQFHAGLAGAPIRWILDDARRFTVHEIRRKQKYHGVLLDPPKFGRGPGGEVWNLFQDLPALLRNCESLLETEQAFLILTTYAVRASSLSFDRLIREILAARKGCFESGEVLLCEAGVEERVLSTSLFTRWISNDF